jgi:thiamine-phosphate pyrophosphorylase
MLVRCQTPGGVPVSDLRADRLARLAAARLYLVCDRTPGGRELSELLPRAIAGGVDVVQLRDKTLTDEELLTAARHARELCARHGALFVVNDRPLVARASGADGVHVGQEDMSVAEARAIVGPDLLIGLSTHAPAEIDAVAADMPVTGGDSGLGGLRSRSGKDRPPAIPDYIGVGPVHATPTKLGRPAVGLELVRYAAAHAPVPFFAIGGLDARNVGEVVAAGARRVCVLRAVADAEHPERAARALREQL